MSYPIIPLYASEFTSSLVLIGVVVSAHAMLRPFFEMPVGAISDVVGRRILIFIGLILNMAGALICAVSTDIIQLVVGRIIWGIGASFFFCTSLVLVSDFFSERGTGKALGVFQAADFVGAVFGTALGGYAATILGFKGLFLTLVMVVLASTIAFVTSAGLRDPAWKRVKLSQSWSWLTIMKGAKTPVIALASCYAFIMFLKERGLIFTVIPLYAKFEVGLSIIELGFVMAGRGIGSSIGTITGGWLYDKIGGRVMLLSGFSITTLSTLLFAWIRNFPSLFAVMVLNGISVGIVLTTIPAMVVDEVSPDMRGRAIGTYRTFMQIGCVFGPILATAIVDSQGFVSSFYTMALLMLLAISASIIFQKRQSSSQRQIVSHR